MHITEKAVDEISDFDYLVQNTSLIDLRNEVKKIYKETTKRGD